VRVRLGVVGQSTPIKFSVSATFIGLKKVEIEPGRLFGFEKWLTSSPDGSEIQQFCF
tara:strand:- start:195 stop:365 length:171 start_codon:yes stop_codon:yes gene_type:complete